MARLTAGARKRADGTLEKRFTIEGKRYSVYGKTAQELAEKEAEIRAGAYKTNARVTLDQYFEEWVKRKEQTIKPVTVRQYRYNYQKDISPFMGRRRVAQIERREVIALQNNLAKRIKPMTVNGIIGLLKQVLKEAERDGIIIHSPADNIRGIKNDGAKASETYHRALTIEEQTAFMQIAKDDFYYELFAFLLCTGVRIGEAGALTWSDIDYKANVIHITKTVTRSAQNKHTIGTPKTKTSKRDIPLTETTRKILKQQRDKVGRVIPLNGRVFPRYDGGLIHSGTIRNTVDRIAKAAGVEHFGVHALRDTFATRFIEQGGTPQTLKTILGHSSLAMTMDLYAHVLPNTKQEEMDRLQIII